MGRQGPLTRALKIQAGGGASSATWGRGHGGGAQGGVARPGLAGLQSPVRLRPLGWSWSRRQPRPVGRTFRLLGDPTLCAGDFGLASQGWV